MTKLSDNEIEIVKRTIISASRVLDSTDDISNNTLLKGDADLDSLSFINVAIILEEELGINLRNDETLFTSDITFSDLITKLDLIK